MKSAAANKNQNVDRRGHRSQISFGTIVKVQKHYTNAKHGDFQRTTEFCVRFTFISTISIGTIECVFVNVFRASFLKGIVK